MSGGSPNTATCTTRLALPAGSDEVTAGYEGDANYASSSGTTSELVEEAPAIASADEATFTDDAADTFTVSATGTPAPTITKWGTLPEGVSFANGVFSGTPTQTGTFQITLTATNRIGVDSTQQFTLTVVGLHVTTSSLPEVTPGVPYSAAARSGRRPLAPEMESDCAQPPRRPQTEHRGAAIGESGPQKIRARDLVPNHADGHRRHQTGAPDGDGDVHPDHLVDAPG